MLQLKKMISGAATIVLCLGLFAFSSFADEIHTGTVSASVLNLRNNPGTSSKVIGSMTRGDKLSILESSGDWLKVKTSEGDTGWAFSRYIALSKDSDENTSDRQSDISTALSEQIVKFSKTLLGTEYLYGGTTPKGFDCSGFVQYVFKQFDISLERVASSQAAQGVNVSSRNLSAGDLVFFDTDGGHNSITHVGIYIGGGQFIHAASGSSTRKVVISDITSGYYANNFMKARRVII
ncbi:SH3 domain-containing C40 family peptidase [Ruminiclostridium cellulolyticum]|uniref:NLP/P60 protein n=1 Tax=Ruminiclostridium cellulolyticum (strain ATCC 35319 / DSM 5812 / JCM 6584 / H10) TaxID=394503 RepID=B8I439_RUMCH|nr:SH3 domain-containing C40 family peptidase [Ruminiclostridium cellulolyticum]ACL76472.1 NLP/P60 protein [Ruminiclostridium cellulolyticum H10]